MLLDLVNAVSHLVPVMQIFHDSGFYAFFPQYMATFAPNQPTFKDVVDKFKER